MLLVLVESTTKAFENFLINGRWTYEEKAICAKPFASEDMSLVDNLREDTFAHVLPVEAGGACACKLLSF